MIDPVNATLLAVASCAPSAVGFAFLAGLVTSVGPCVAPRYIAVTSIANGYRKPFIPTLVFVGGLIGAFLAIGFAAGSLGSLLPLSTAVYAILALGLMVAGCVTLVRAVPADLHPTHCRSASCATGTPDLADHRSLGAIFLLGAASALVVSPCCTPVVITLVATTMAMGQPLFGIALLTSFAVGHALPLFFAGSVASALRRVTQARVGGQAPAIVAGTLMVALGAYYGILA